MTPSLRSGTRRRLHTGFITVLAHSLWLASAAAQPTVPGTPSNLQASVVGAQVTLSWSPPPGAPSISSYVVEAGSVPGGANLARFDTGSPATSLTVSAPPGTYYVRVRGRLSGNVGAPSNEVVVSAPSSCSGPQPPSGLAYTLAGNLVRLSWQPAALATGYVIEAGSASGLANIASLATGSLTTLDAAAPAGTYYVRARTRNACGTSAPSNEIMVVVAGCTAPGAPGTLVASVTGSTVTLNWTAAAGNASGYVVEVGATPGTANLARVNAGAATSLTTTAPNGTYYVRVRALNPCGTGPASNEVTVTVSALQPPGSEWLTVVNRWRARAGVAPVVEEPSWSLGAAYHARYTVKTNQHPYRQENSSSPWFTPEGNAVVGNSIAWWDTNIGWSDASAIDHWLSIDWYEGLAMLDTRLRRVGFGSFREPDAAGGLAMTAVIDVVRGREEPAPRAVPAVFPAPGVEVLPYRQPFCEDGTACSTHRYPGEAMACGFYEFDMGIPIFMQFGTGVTPVLGTTTLTSQGSALPVCSFTAASYRHGDVQRERAVRTTLAAIGGVVIFPRFPLLPGRTYSVSTTVNGVPYQWSFRVR